MSKIEISVDWLVSRAEQEQLNILKNKMGLISFMLSSKEKREKNLEQAQKSLGRIEMIHEIMAKSNSNMHGK